MVSVGNSSPESCGRAVQLGPVLRWRSVLLLLLYVLEFRSLVIDHDSRSPSGKRCDCKSLHWKFSDKRTCDGTYYRQSATLNLAHNFRRLRSQSDAARK
jgi:hypothetical protein